ncbi:MAG: hypothetical protein IH872_05105 [Chloroflexi bacterium]|nr:hypothetical protein [Chloroflexota bacterium]
MAEQRGRSDRPRKELGNWEVKRSGPNQISLTIPDGMEIIGDDLTLEDVLGAISNYMIVRQGRVLACCSGNIAIA